MLDNIDFATGRPVAAILREHPDGGPGAQAHGKFGTYLYPTVGKGKLAFGNNTGRGDGNNRIGPIAVRPLCTPRFLVEGILDNRAVVTTNDVQITAVLVAIRLTGYRVVLLLAVAGITLFISPFAVVGQTGTVELIGEDEFGIVPGNLHRFQVSVVVAFEAPLGAVVRFEQQGFLGRQSIRHGGQLLGSGKSAFTRTRQVEFDLDRYFSPPVYGIERAFKRSTFAHLQAHQSVGIALGGLSLAVQQLRVGIGTGRDCALDIETHRHLLVGHGVAFGITHHGLVGYPLYGLGTQIGHRKEGNRQYGQNYSFHLSLIFLESEPCGLLFHSQLSIYIHRLLCRRKRLRSVVPQRDDPSRADGPVSHTDTRC